METETKRSNEKRLRNSKTQQTEEMKKRKTRTHLQSSVLRVLGATDLRKASFVMYYKHCNL